MPEQLASERAALEPELIETRRALHRRPELAFADFDIDERAIGVTAEILARAALVRLGLTT